MKIEKTHIKDLLIIKPNIYNDERGFFLEAFNNNRLIQNGIIFNIYQENQAFSNFGVLRGLHYQVNPFAQRKLVRAVYGEILDVAVDLRPNSKTFGKHFKILLSGKGNEQLLIPAGFAHGALTVSAFSLMAYYTDAPYSSEYSRAIKYDDAELNIDWGVDNIIVSEADKNAESFKEFIKSRGLK